MWYLNASGQLVNTASPTTRFAVDNSGSNYFIALTSSGSAIDQIGATWTQAEAKAAFVKLAEAVGAVDVN
jgi:mannose/cellobiose epimerase-like protein (N-acyl-D-glucosamine 2-epimerase family)